MRLKAKQNSAQRIFSYLIAQVLCSSWHGYLDRIADYTMEGNVHNIGGATKRLN